MEATIEHPDPVPVAIVNVTMTAEQARLLKNFTGKLSLAKVKTIIDDVMQWSPWEDDKETFLPAQATYDATASLYFALDEVAL